MVKICPSCEKENDINDIFCINCGEMIVNSNNGSMNLKDNIIQKSHFGHVVISQTNYSSLPEYICPKCNFKMAKIHGVVDGTINIDGVNVPYSIEIFENSDAYTCPKCRYKCIFSTNFKLTIDSQYNNATFNKKIIESEGWDCMIEGGVKNINTNLEIQTEDELNEEGKKCRHLGQFDKSIEYYEKVLKMNPENLDAWNGMSGSLLNLGRFDEAIKSCDEAIKIRQNEVAWYNKGIALDELNKLEDAIKCFENTLGINPKSWLAWYNKGKTLNNLKKYDAAIKCFEKTLEINPKSWLAWYYKGITLDNFGWNLIQKIDNDMDYVIIDKFNEAINCFEKVLELNPNYEDAIKSQTTAKSHLAVFRGHL